MISLYVIIHYDESMKEYLIEGCTFSSMTAKVFPIKRRMNLQRMKEVTSENYTRKQKKGLQQFTSPTQLDLVER